MDSLNSKTLPYKFTAKEQDEETGLYYYGARYLDAKYSRWMSADPAVGEYIPQAPVNDEARKHNQSLPGMGGVFNVVNFQLYHYAGNNPVKYIDPDGESVFVVGALIVWGINSCLFLYSCNASNSQIKGRKLYNQIDKYGSISYSFKNLYNLYASGFGKDVTLSQVGLLDKIKNAVASNPNIREGSKNDGKTIQDAFITNDIIGSGKDSFENSYDFTGEIFEIGGATVSGKFVGSVTKNADGSHHVKGTITYSFSDIFQDPYDMDRVKADPSGKAANFDGVPYKITDTWTVNIDGDY